MIARVGLLTLALAMLAGIAASAAVVTTVVTPTSMGDWNLAVQLGGAGETPVGEFAKVGPAVSPAGTGSFHFKPFYSAAAPLQKIYLGTNLFSGRSLNDVVTFKYYTFLAARDYGTSGNPLGQPPVIELNTDSGNSVQQREFVYKPYGWYGGHNVGLNRWQEWDLLAAGGRWDMYHTGSTNFTGDWSWVTHRYYNETTQPIPMKFATPIVGDYLSAAGPNNELSNQSGTSLSIRVGSSRVTDKYFAGPENDPNPLDYGGVAGWIPWPWWREAAGIDGYVDKLVIGFSNGDEYTFDFEGGSLGTVAITGRDTKTYSASAGRKNFQYVVFGVAVTDPNILLTADEFLLFDGSRLVKVSAPGALVLADQGYYYRAKGTLDNGPDPAVVYSSSDNVERISP